MIYQLPVTSQPNQTFTTTIPVGDANVRFRFFINWNTCTSTWEASVEVNDTETIMSHIPLMVGDITSYLDYKGYGNLRVVNVGDSDFYKPDLTNLATSYLVVWETPDAVA